MGNTFTQRVKDALHQDLIEGTVFRVDMDRVDVVPNGSTGIIRSLPLTGDRDKIAVGDPIRVVTVGGDRVALAADMALFSEVDDTVPVTEVSSTISGWDDIAMGLSSSAGGWDGWAFLDAPLFSANWQWKTVNTNLTGTPLNVVTEFGVPAGAEAILARVVARDNATWGSNTTGAGYYFGLGPSTGYGYSAEARVYGADLRNSSTAIIRVDTDGNVYWTCRASGTDTMDVYIDIWGYKMPSSPTSSAGNRGWVYLPQPLTSTAWDGDAYSTMGTKTAINLQTTFGVPSNAKAVLMRVACKDSASATTPTASFMLWTDPFGTVNAPLIARCGGLANGSYAENLGVVPIGGDGYIYFTNTASGTSTMNVYLQVYGYLLGDDTLATGWVFYRNNITSSNWPAGKLLSTTPSSAKVKIDLSADFGLPDNIQAVIVRLAVRDSGSAAADCTFTMTGWSAAMGAAGTSATIDCSGLANNMWERGQFVIPTDENGDIWYWGSTSGTNTMEVRLDVTGYLLPSAVEIKNAHTVDGYEARMTGNNGHLLLTDANGNITVNTITATGGYIGMFDADTVDGKHSWEFAAATQWSGAFSVTAGNWYRIVNGVTGIGHFSGIVALDWALAGYHGRVLAFVSTMYGATPSISILGSSTYQQTIPELFSKMRIVYHTSYNGNTAYLELYCPTVTNAVNLSVRLIESIQMTCVTPTVGSVPSGYSTYEMEIPHGGAQLPLQNVGHPTAGNVLYANNSLPKFMVAGGMMMPLANQDVLGSMLNLMPMNFVSSGHVKSHQGTLKLTDQSGADNHFTLTNVTGNRTWANTYFAGGHSEYNGTTAFASYPTCTHLANNNWQGGAMWLYPDAFAPAGQARGIVAAGQTTPGWGLWLTETGTIGMHIYRGDTGAAFPNMYSTNAMVVNQWNFIGWDFYWNSSTSNGVRLFVNGTWTVFSNNILTTTVAPRMPVGELRIGFYNNSYYDGLIGPTCLGGWIDMTNIDRMYHTQRTYFGL